MPHRRLREKQLGYKDREHGHPHHGQGACRESHPRQSVAETRAVYILKIPAFAGYFRNARCRHKQQGLGGRVANHMVDAGNDPRRGPQSKSHVNITDLRHGRVCDHPPYIALPNGVQRTHNHSCDSEYEQHMDHLTVPDYIKTDHPVKYFHQQKDIPLGHQRRQNRRRGQSGISICIRQPGMERKQGTFDGQTHAHKTDCHQQGRLVLPAVRQRLYALPDIAHQQMSCKIIEKAQAQQQQAGSQQTHDHITGGRLNGPPVLPDHNQTAGGNGVDFHKYIGGKQIVGIKERQQGTEQQIHHDIVQVLFARLDLRLPLPGASPHTQQHDYTKNYGQQRLQNTCPELVSPGGGKMPHGINKGLPCPRRIPQHGPGQQSAQRNHCPIRPFRPFSIQNRGQRPGKQRQYNGEKGKIANELHYFSSLFNRVEISSRSRL